MSHLIINECRKCGDVFENWNDQTTTTQGNLINPLNERKFLPMNAPFTTSFETPKQISSDSLEVD